MIRNRISDRKHVTANQSEKRVCGVCRLKIIETLFILHCRTFDSESSHGPRNRAGFCINTEGGGGSVLSNPLQSSRSNMRSRSQKRVICL